MKKTLFIIFILVLFLGLGAFYYFNWRPNHFNTSSQEVTLDVNSEIVQSLYKDMNPSGDALIMKPVYLSLKLTNEYIIDIGIMKYLRDNPDIDPEYIDPEIVLENAKKVLGDDISIENQTVHIFYHGTNGIDGVCGYKFNSEANRYESLHGCDGSYYEFIYRKIVDAKETDDHIYITEKLIYLYNDWDDYISRRFVYNDCNKTKLLNYIEKSSTEAYHVNIDDYLDEASTYIYSFKKDNDHWIFESIEKSE